MAETPASTRGPAGVIDGPNLARTLGRVRDRVAAARRAGRRPLLIGGDCPILLGAVAGCHDAGDEPLGLLFVDGHEDAWPAHASTTGEAADMELGWLLGPWPRRPRRRPRGRRSRRWIAGRIALLGPRDRAELDAAGVASVADVVPVLDDVDRPGRSCRRDGLGAGRRQVRRPVRGGSTSTSTSCRPRHSRAVDYQQPGGAVLGRPRRGRRDRHRRRRVRRRVGHDLQPGSRPGPRPRADRRACHRPARRDPRRGVLSGRALPSVDGTETGRHRRRGRDEEDVRLGDPVARLEPWLGQGPRPGHRGVRRGSPALRQGRAPG